MHKTKLKERLILRKYHFHAITKTHSLVYDLPFIHLFSLFHRKHVNVSPIFRLLRLFSHTVFLLDGDFNVQTASAFFIFRDF